MEKIDRRKKPNGNIRFKGEIELMCSIGTPDDEIAETLGISRTYVVNTTTKYWERKMKEAHGNDS